MAEQRCVTCHYYDPIPDTQAGYCVWSETHAAPACMDRGYFEVWHFEGSDCRTWQAKEDIPSC